jgi:hypothetical protein
VIWFRCYRGLLIASVAALVAGAFTALAYRGQLIAASDIAQAPFGAWDVVLMTTQDPYIVAYFLWPVLTIVLGHSISLRARAAVLLRHGSRAAFVLDEAVRAVPVGAVLAMLLTGSSLVGTSGLGWELTWSPLALAREDLVESLHAQATAGLAFIPVLAAQVLYLTISGGFLGSAIALLALLSARHYRLFVIVVALSMPVIFKAWPLPAASNPINALVTAHAVMTGLPLWAAPVACLFGIAVLGVLAFGMDRRSANRALSSTRVRIDRRWAWYWLIVGIGMLATAPLQDPELPLASQLLYGASTEGLSFVRWAFAVIVWGGLALVLMLRWSHTLTARLPYLLLRHGRATTLVARQSARDVVSGLSYVFLLLTMTAIFDAATGRPMLGWADALHLLIAGPLVAASIASAGVIVGWLAHGVAPMTVTLVACTILTVPALNPAWPWPMALAFLGGRPPEALPTLPIFCAGATFAALLLTLTFLAHRQAPSFV